MSADQEHLVGVVNGLANAIRTAEIPAQHVSRISSALEQARAMIDEHIVPPPYAVEQLAPPNVAVLQWDPDDLCSTVPYSPFLGRLNPISGDATLRAEGATLSGTIRLSPIHAGPIGMAHGGVVAALLDELTSIAVMTHGRFGYTRTLTVTYLRPTPLDGDLSLWAQSAGHLGSGYLTSAEIRSGGKVTASAVAVHHPGGRVDEPIYPDTVTR
ncbi:thioesterase [Mycolicibacterium anyangense]|uniref:Thioesterase n=1 Tax=Mycolicibacterium anyangense TaxID=1431246 RepID=A0A6N4W538_9MYCO|nr:PaaI family thioesterase [Mycolicibacterium anyangense]BBZ75493.1 thioesterase [Mycolicibacterium anyangense]